MASNLTHKIQTNFSSGVISENAFGRIDTALYNNGLSIGENIIIENPGGMARRPGTLFSYEFEEDYVTLVPFSFNTEQTYLLAFSELKLEIFLNDPDGIPIIQAALTTPYTAEQLKEFDYAQSADVMAITHTTHPVQALRRLGSDASWELVPVPFANPPQELRCTDGKKPQFDGTCSDASSPALQNVWGPLNGYPSYCTFFQGRLYLARTKLLPQHVWGSVSQDFFNFLAGDNDGDSVHDILDTDFINPITAIYAEKKLFVFSTGDEFVNDAAVITPAASAWQRVSKNGSFGKIRPVTLDGGVIYLDRSGRTLRTLRFNDSIKAFDSQSVSLYSEHLIRAPIDMGIMRGTLFQASNFLYLVNDDGTVAVLNLSEAVGMSAWTLWKTQGAFKEVLTFNNELTYVLVERNNKWILEKLEDGIYVDSGAVQTTTQNVIIKDIVTYEGVDVTYEGNKVTHGFISVDTDAGGAVGDRDNFYGISYDTKGYGRIVIVADGEIIYINHQFKKDPIIHYSTLGNVFLAITRFAEDVELQDQYFETAPGTEFYLYSMIVTQEVNFDKNFIDGLPHLIGREVVMNLDGSAFRELTVVPGDQLPGGGLLKSYPDGEDWLFNETAGSETYIVRYVDANLVTTRIDGYYNGTRYDYLTLNSFWNGYSITHTGAPVENDEFLEQGVVQTEDGQTAEFTSSGSYTVPPGVTSLDICMCGGGGGGGVGRGYNGGGGSGGGGSGYVKKTISVSEGQILSFIIGLGGKGGYETESERFDATDGNQSSFIINGNTTVAIGGKKGIIQPKYSTTTTPGGLGVNGGGNGGYGSAGEHSNSQTGRSSNATPCGIIYPGGIIYAVNATYSYNGAGGGAGAKGQGGAGGRGLAYGTTGTNLQGQHGNGYGSGGGGGTFARQQPIGNATFTAGDGAPGLITIYANGIGSLIRKYKTKKMELVTAAVPTTDGIVETPRIFARGQVGLWFGVNAQTMPLNAGTVINEPKRIVSVMARFVNTAGLNIGNHIIPEREYGDEVLDQSLPKKSGIRKLRLFGYTRETTLKITQNDPLPMTLTSLDLEIKI